MVALTVDIKVSHLLFRYAPQCSCKNVMISKTQQLKHNIMIALDKHPTNWASNGGFGAFFDISLNALLNTQMICR